MLPVSNASYPTSLNESRSVIPRRSKCFRKGLRHCLETTVGGSPIHTETIFTVLSSTYDFSCAVCSGFLGFGQLIRELQALRRHYDRAANRVEFWRKTSRHILLHGASHGRRE